MSSMRVRTNHRFAGTAGSVWPLLCNSRMDGRTLHWFNLGIPQPLECRLPDGRGGVDSERECVSNQGTVHQRILEWIPEKRLVFRMERTDLRFRRYVRELVDTFELVPIDGSVTVTRTSEVELDGRFQALRKLALYVSLKQVHRYVFRNWARLVNAQRTPESAFERGSPLTPFF
jgi:hypothetical protein